MSKVYLVGAGPGDPDLITKKGYELIARADVILYDKLANPELLSHAGRECEQIFVGKEAGHHHVTQEETNRLIVEKAKQGKLVVRLKGGDPLIFGRGSEEAVECRKAGIDFEFVPGITAASGATAYAGIPLTHRNLVTKTVFVTAHESGVEDRSKVDWENIARLRNSTIVIYMGVKKMPKVSRILIDNGMPADTDIAVISNGTLPHQRTYTGKLENIEEMISQFNIKPPSIFVLGPTIGLREDLRWNDNKALFGKRIVTTRAIDQTTSFYNKLAEEGAEIIPIRTIRTELTVPEKKIMELLGNKYDWIFFTSENGVRYFFELMTQEGLDARAFRNTRIAVVGSHTAEKLEKLNIRADFLPENFTAEELIREFRVTHDLTDLQILRVKGNFLNDKLTENLRESDGIVDTVEVYRTIRDKACGKEVDDLIENGADAFTFTSGSTVEGFYETVGNSAAGLLNSSKVVAIGPVTAESLRSKGVKDIIISKVHTIDGMIETLKEEFAKG